MMTGKRTTICGFGINDADYVTQKFKVINGKRVRVWFCPAYSAWVSMIKRSYSTSVHNRRPTYINVSVCDEWRFFSSFKEWFDCNYVAGWHLDKDLIINGNKIYCPEFCAYVPKDLNMIFCDRGSLRGEFLIGVHFDNSSGKFVSQCHEMDYESGKSKRINIGRFFSEIEAHGAYLSQKRKSIMKAVNHYRLNNHSNERLMFLLCCIERRID